MANKTDELLSQLEDMRVVTLSKISSESIPEIKRGLISLAIKSADPVIMLIDSPGGSVIQGFSLIDFMAMLNVVTIGIVNGNCSSMAVPVLQACTHRWATKHSRFLLHAMSNTSRYVYDDDTEEVFNDYKRVDKSLHDQYVDFVSKRLKKSREELERTLKIGDKFGGYLSTEEALEWGLLDKVIGPDDFKLVRRVDVTRPTLVPFKFE